MRQIVALLVLFGAAPFLAGFDLSRHSIPPGKILSGGPPKDGIPAILEPRFLPAGEASFLGDGDRVIGVVHDAVAKAYPIRILNWHEVVNDTAGSRSIAVTYCPLTGSGLVYDRKVGDRELTFGVSGRLYQSNVLLYDKATESLWSQIQEEAVTGDLTGSRLTPIPSVDTTWGKWRREHPETLVLSPETGHSRPYERDPYDDYRRSPEIMFPPSRIDRRLPPKDWVVGAKRGEDVIAFAADRLAAAKGPVEATLGGKTLILRYDAATRTAEAKIDGKPYPLFTGYWFAWYAFHPRTRVWEPASPRSSLHDVPEVSIVGHEGSWGDLTGVAPGGELAEAGSFYVIKGTLRNDSGVPIGFARLRYELVNDAGEVVYREYGYNRRAERLKDREFESGRKTVREMKVEAVPAAGTDTFRMFFFRDELPPFREYRVIVEHAG